MNTINNICQTEKNSGINKINSNFFYQICFLESSQSYQLIKINVTDTVFYFKQFTDLLEFTKKNNFLLSENIFKL